MGFKKDGLILTTHIIDELKDTTGICEHCENSLGEFKINPYDEDIHGTQNYEYICSTCYNILCDEI